MQAPSQFIIRNNENKLQLNEEVLEIIKKSTNPQFFLFYGKTRTGKSTTLNQLIRGNLETRKYKNKKPFETLDSLDSVTKGCQIYGPVKASELMKKHKIKNKKKNFEDFDIFFCDTEGIPSLDIIQKESIPGILTLLQISTMSVFMVQKNCDVNNLKEICSQIQMSRCLKQISEQNQNIKNYFPTPRIAVYIANIFLGLEQNEDEEIYDDFDEMIPKYEDSKDREKVRILKAVNEKYNNLNLNINDFDVIPGGPYDDKNHKEPDEDDVNANLYWWSINKLMERFLSINRKKMNSTETINLINFLFDIFQGIKSIDEDFNLEEFLKVYLTQKFENYSKKKFEEKLEKIKDDIKTNFLEYFNIINDAEKAKISLNECFDENIDLYKKLIKDKVENFINLNVEIYQKKIKEQIDNEFKSICDNILSDDNVNVLIKDVVDLINQAEFKEDIDMNKVKNLDVFWDSMYEQNKIILDYFKETKSGVLNNLKQNFLFKINTIFQNLMKKKIEFASYSKNNLVNLQNEINKIYIDNFSKCNYQEDFDNIIKKPENLFEEIFPLFIEKFFKNISNDRSNEIKEKVKQIIQKEYDNIKKNKLPTWKNIKSDLITRIEEAINSYLSKIFNEKKFRDEIDPNLGRKDVIYNVIPSDIKQNSFVKNEKKNEINQILEKEIENAVNNFNKLREKLPLFNESMVNIIKQCSQLIDNKIKEFLNKIFYKEEKIIFDSDKIFSFLTKDQNIYKNCGTKLNDINVKLRELSETKAKEYDLLVDKNKPEWKKILSEKNKIINDWLKDFINKKFEKAKFQDNIKTINPEDITKSIKNISGLYYGVADHKKNEINQLIEDNIQSAIEKIYFKKNTLQNWDTIKHQKIQDAYIEMSNKAKTDLKTLDVNKVTQILVEHIKLIPKFFDFCKEEEKKNQLLNEITIKAKIIANEYVQNKTNEINKQKKIDEQFTQLNNERINMVKAVNETRQQLENAKRNWEQEKNNLIHQIEEQRRAQQQQSANNQNVDIENLARRAINGEFGNGQERRNRLGNLFPAVQNRVNEILGYPKRY